MPNNNDGISDNVKIVDYWNRRGPGLSNEEWVEFYSLLFPVLMRTRLPSEFNPTHKRKDLVNTFFYDKVFLNAGTSKAGPLQNVHAVHLYLKRYAVDMLESDGDDTTTEPDAAGDVAAPPHQPGYAKLLGEAGIDIGTVVDSADRFLVTLDCGERACLREHSCADKPHAQPVSRIAERLKMGPSYHRIVRNLGITRTNGDTYAGYETTKIGRWLCGLGARLHPEWREELATLLIILCERVRIFKDKTA